MKLIKRIAIFISAALIMCAGCSSDNNNIVQIDPNQDISQSTDKNISLYFGDATGHYLVKESRKIDLSANQSLEEYVIKELIKGPNKNAGDKIALINAKSKLISVKSNGEILTLILSREFLDWSFVSAKTDRDQSRIKKLAVYSLVNTLVETSRCPKVQILVESTAGGSGQRLTTDQVGITGEENAILGALYWDGSFILSPANTMKVMLTSLQQSDYETAYTLIAYSDENGEKPNKSAFTSLLDTDWMIETFTVNDYSVGADGSSACVILSFTSRNLKNERIYEQYIPAILVNENDVWKMEYTEFVSIFTVNN